MGWTRFFRREDRDRECTEEIQAHIAIETDSNIDRGMAPDEARREAVRKFGNAARIREEIYGMNSFGAIETILQDLKFGFRSLQRTPGFTAVAILTLALGIGANTAIFTVIQGVLLEPLPFKDPKSLMVLNERDERRTEFPAYYSLSYVNFQDWRERQHSFSDMALFRSAIQFNGMVHNTRNLITLRMVSANFFQTLGVAPLFGRDFTADDDRPGAVPTAILTYSGWQKLFAGYAASTFSEAIEMNKQSYRVVGVMPQDLSEAYTMDSNQVVDAFIPIGLSTEPWTRVRERRPNLSGLGRLNPNATPSQAQADLDAIAQELEVEFPVANSDRGASVTPIHESVVDEKTRTALFFLLVAVGFVLLIACVNVANLLLARGGARQKEISIRTALGAGKWRVVRQLLVESLLLGSAGGVAGVIVAIALTDLLVIGPAELPRIAAIGVDWRVLLFSFVTAVLTGIIFGFVPALQALRTDVQASLKDGAGNSTTRRFRPQRLLIISEIALAFLLLHAAGLVIRSTANAVNVDPGFDPQGVASFRVVMSPNEFASGEETHNFFRRLEDRLRENPAVQAASLALGNPPKPAVVNRDYLKLMGLTLQQGRFFDARDTLNSKPVIVIDELLAKARFPGESPIGKPFVIDMPEAKAIGLDKPREVIGIVNHVKRFGIETDDQIVLQAQFYISTEQIGDAGFEGAAGGLRMFIKSRWPDRELFGQISQIVSRVDSNRYNGDITTAGVISLKNTVDQALAPRFFVTRQLGVFAAIAFLLAAVGIYGVIAYSVSRRTQELGVRMALGADARHIAAMVMKDGGMMAAIGITVGLLSSLWLNKFIQFLLFDITPTDPMMYTTTVVLLLGAAILASYIPAHRALLLGPMNALRGASPTGAVVRDARSFAGVQERQTIHHRGMGEPQTEPVIEVFDLQKTFSGLRNKPVAALGGVSLRVAPGKIFGLIGQNGAGKTTLVKILMGLCRPTSGRARLLGCVPGNPIAHRRIGYLPESMRIPDHFMAEDFLNYMGRLNGVSPETLRNRIPELLETVGLTGVHKPVKTYSKGMQQRLGLAQALINDPELLFLDEPTDGLDPLGRIDVRDLLLRLRSQGKTIFLNSHLLSEVESVCDQIVILNKGVVACTTTPAEFTRGTGEYRVRVAQPEASVCGVAESIVESATLEGDTLRFTPRDAAQLNELLDAFRRVPVTILSVEPVRLSLEQFFIEVVGEKEV